MTKKEKDKQKHKIVFLEGRKVILRLLQEEDINERYLSWLNDKEVTKYMETGNFPTTLAELHSFYDKITKSRTEVMFAIVTKHNKLHIGNIKLGNINWIHRYANLGIMIGDKRYWSRGFAQEACRLLLEHAFIGLNLNKVFLGVYATHSPALKAYKKIGFKIEGRMRKMFSINNKYVDKVIMGILREEFSRNYKRQIR